MKAALLYKGVGGRKRTCCLCGHKLRSFMPYRGKGSPFTRAMRTIGSNTEQYRCPYCRSHDRARHLFLYLGASGLLDKVPGAAVLHFAPESGLTDRIAERQPAKHVLADIEPHPDWTKVDLMAMPFLDASFDILIANHILEHVADYRVALAEIRRVLKPGGHAILQTPYSNILADTFEDAGIVDKGPRLMAYGQDNHVRLFGKNFVSLIEVAGFQSEVRTHSQLLGGYSGDTYGLNEREPFMCFRRDDGQGGEHRMPPGASRVGVALSAVPV